MSEYNSSEVAEKIEMSKTKLDVNNLTYTWTLRGFTLQEGDHKCLLSPPFSPQNNMVASWCLNLRRSYKSSKYFGLYLRMTSSLNTHVRGYFKCSIINHSGIEVKTRTGHTIDFENWKTYGFDKLLKRSYINRMVPFHKLTFVFEINYIINQFEFPDEHENLQKEAQQELRQNFQKVLDNEKFSDVTLLVDGEKFRAHKAILSTKSKVFAAMFEHDMEEKQTNCVVINGISTDVFKEMLSFMYSNNAPNLEELAMELFAAADMYALNTLKEICEQTISVNLCVETSVATLILADLHSSEELKSEAIDFINAHIEDVMQTESWQNIKDMKF